MSLSSLGGQRSDFNNIKDSVNKVTGRVRMLVVMMVGDDTILVQEKYACKANRCFSRHTILKITDSFSSKREILE